MKNEHLQGWVFHYNPYTGLWNAVLREYYVQYLNGMADDHVLSASSMGNLLKMVKEKDAQLH